MNDPILALGKNRLANLLILLVLSVIYVGLTRYLITYGIAVYSARVSFEGQCRGPIYTCYYHVCCVTCGKSCGEDFASQHIGVFSGCQHWH